MTTIKLKNGSGAPTAGDLVQGEPALDLTNKRLYTENASGTVIEVGTNPTSITTGDITATGTATFANLATSGDVTFGDNDKAVFGAGSDLQIYHSGSQSVIADSGTGQLTISTNGTDVRLSDNSGNRMLIAKPGAEVELYHNASAKLATTSTGIDVTGSVTADGGTFDGNVLMNSSNELQFFNTNYGIRASTGLEIKTGDFTRFLEGSTEHMRIASGGDISFYNDAGTSQDLYWDASTSRLGLGNIAPTEDLHIGDGTASVALTLQGTDAGINAINMGDATNRFAGRILYNNSVNDFAFYCAGSERMRITGSGNVGIGTDAPGEELHISASVPTLRLQDSDGTSQFSNLIHSNGSLFLYARNGSSYGTFNFVGDNGTSQDTFIQINKDAIQNLYATSWYIRNRVNGGSLNLGVETSAGSLYYPVQMNGTSDVLVFNNAEGEMARFDTNGNLFIGKSSASFGTEGIAFNTPNEMTITRDSGTCVFLRRNTADGEIQTFYKDTSKVGSISVTSSATAYNTSSDQRLKDNIVDAPSASDDIDAIQVRSFDWKADGSHQKYGMVAQELNTVAPEAVTEGETEDDMMSVDYSKLVPMLVKEIQSLRARVAQLEGTE